MVFALLGASGNFGIKDTAGQPAARAARLPARRPSRERRDGLGRRSPSRSACRAWRSSPPACERSRTPGWCARTTAGATLAFPLGAVLVAASLRRARARSRRSTTAPTWTCSTPSCGAGSPTWSGSRSSASSTTRSGRGARAGHRRAAGAATRAAVLRGELSTGAIKAVGALGARRLRDSGPGREALDYVVDLGAAAAGDQHGQPARPAAGPGREGARRCSAPVSASATGRSTPLELLGLFIGPVLVGAWFTLRERAMLGDTGSNLRRRDRRAAG